jgi:hypothetical protein
VRAHTSRQYPLGAPGHDVVKDGVKHATNINTQSDLI